MSSRNNNSNDKRCSCGSCTCLNSNKNTNLRLYITNKGHDCVLFYAHIITVKILFFIIKSVQSKGNLCKIIGLQCILSRFNSVLSSLFGDADNFDVNKRLLTLLKVEFKRV